MRSEVRWTVVVMVLAVAGVVALWPRSQTPPYSADTGSRPQLLDALTSMQSPAVNDAELAVERGRARLQPCPSAPPQAEVPSGPLRDVVVPCLGSPGTVNLAAAMAGRPVLLNLWASWCQPCREELPVLDAYAASDPAVPVIGVNVRDRPADGLSLLAALGVDFPSVADPDGRLQGALRAPPVLPMSFVLHRDGRVTPIEPPRVLRSQEEIRQALAAAGEP